MSRDEQIEEMANAILYQGDNYDTCCKDDCETIASLIYNKGYRKASEVAEEIFAEIEKLIEPNGAYLWRWDLNRLAELKKKYTEE